MADPGLSFQAGKKKNAKPTDFYSNDTVGKQLLKSESDFYQFRTLSPKRQDELKDQFKNALGIPLAAKVDFEKSTRGIGVVLTNKDNQQHFLRAYVTMPGETGTHAIRIYLSPATRLNKFFIDQQLVPRTSEHGVAGTIMEKLSARKSENGEAGSLALVASHPKNGNFYFATATRANFKDPNLPAGALNTGFKFQLFEVTAKGETKEILLDKNSQRVFPDQQPRIELETKQGKLSFPNPNWDKGTVKLGDVNLVKQRREGAL
jgi:hypothetical protein